MLAAATNSYRQSNTFIPTPPPLPLSPRSANARPSRQAMTDAPKSQSLWSKRAAKPNPLLKSRDTIRNTRRDLYLKRVQKGRDEERWVTRGDQILRSDYMSERRMWEAELARTAPSLEEPPEEDEVADLPIYSSQNTVFKSQTDPGTTQLLSDDAREVDDMQRQEEEDLEALLALMEAEEEQNHPPRAGPSQSYGSDDEDYDSIFLNLANAGVEQVKHSAVEVEAMDTSNG